MSGRQPLRSSPNRLPIRATLVWNGPFGAFETAPFDRGTVAAAKAVARRTKAGNLLSVAGGGDTVAALNHAGVADDFTYVSTAGGAFLEWLEGQELPGVAALEAAKGSHDRWIIDELNRIAQGDGGERQGHSRRRRKLRHDQEALRRDRRDITEDNRRDYREMMFRTRTR